MALWKQILIAMLLAVITGFAVRHFIPEPQEISFYLGQLGELFKRLLKMIIVPLVFCSVVAGITSMNDPKAMGRIGLKAFMIYIFTTMFAISFGLIVANIIEPGVGAQLPLADYDQATIQTKLSNAPTHWTYTFLNIIPQNPIAALASNNNMLQILFFAVFVGVAATYMGKKTKPFVDANNSMSEIMVSITYMVMKVAPICVFGLLASAIIQQGTDAFGTLLKLAGTFLIGATLHVCIVYGLIIKLWLRLPVFKYIRNIVNALTVAFSTSSSSATLPVTIRTAQERLGVSKSTANFVLPLGATINMDGTALYQGVCVVFVAQMLGHDLTFAEYVIVILTSTLASIGTAGIPSAGIIMLGMVLIAIDLPTDAIAFILAIDRLLDMVRTMINVTADTVVSVAIDKGEGRFNREVFDADQEIVYDD